MPKDFYSKLEKLLKKDSRFIDQEGDLLKTNVIDAAYKADKKLMEALLSQKEFKNKFFSKIKDALVFNINDFVEYISDKNFLADSYTKYRNKIGLNIDEKFLNERKEVALVWPFKDCVLEGGMTKEDEKRKEIFFNEILAQDEIDKLFSPKVLTNWKRYTQKGEQKVKELKRDKDGTIQENLIIKGNNLLALHSLKQQFQNKIKLIYIDPPYNTGNDSFGYNNNFNHSTWLTFMKNRLEVARELLKDDGVIFISCDDNEQAYLKVLCDEVFGRENFIASMPWKGRGGRQDATHVADIHEFILFFAKDKNKFIAGSMVKFDEKFPKYDEQKKLHYKTQLARKWGSNSKRENRPNLYYPIEAPDGKNVYPKLPNGKDGCWRWSKERMLKEINNGNIEFVKENSKWISYQKIYEPKNGEIRTKKFTTWLDDVGTTSEGTKEIENLFNKKIFDYPKPPDLIKRLLSIGDAKDNDIISDFFAGSGTTAQAVLELNKEDGGNRKFILVEQLGYVEKITVERVKRVIKKEKIKDDFVYYELMKYNERFVEKIKKANDAKTLLKIWEEMQKKSFLNYNVDIKKFDETISEFKKLSIAKQKRTLFNLLNKNQLYVNLSEIKDRDFKVGEGDKKTNNNFYKF